MNEYIKKRMTETDRKTKKYKVRQTEPAKQRQRKRDRRETDIERETS